MYPQMYLLRITYEAVIMYYFIVNPVSSSGGSMRVWNQCSRILKDRGVPYHVFLLKKEGDVEHLAQRIAQKCLPCTVVIVGGDGTINQFLDALPSCDGLTFGCIPVGSGNDFARGLNIPSAPEAALELILDHARVKQINLGRTSTGEKERVFAVSSGIGYDAAVCYGSLQSPLKTLLNRIGLGKLIYMANALGMLYRMKMFSVRLVTDDHQLQGFENVSFAAAMNVRCEGGGFPFSPKADPSDGLLDLILAEGMPKWKILLALPLSYFGLHTRFRGVHIIRCRSASLRCDSPQCVHTDGEHFGFTEKVTFRVSRRCLNVIAP